MCPACFANVGWIAGSAMSMGGVTALAAKVFRPNKTKDIKQRRTDDGNNNERSLECESSSAIGVANGAKGITDQRKRVYAAAR